MKAYASGVMQWHFQYLVTIFRHLKNDQNFSGYFQYLIKKKDDL
jgi:hypothetical protein